MLCSHYSLTSVWSSFTLSHFTETAFVKVTDENHSVKLTVQIICLYFTWPEFNILDHVFLSSFFLTHSYLGFHDNILFFYFFLSLGPVFLKFLWCFSFFKLTSKCWSPLGLHSKCSSGSTWSYSLHGLKQYLYWLFSNLYFWYRILFCILALHFKIFNGHLHLISS